MEILHKTLNFVCPESLPEVKRNLPVESREQDSINGITAQSLTQGKIEDFKRESYNTVFWNVEEVLLVDIFDNKRTITNWYYEGVSEK